jgi:hypothetical protein
LVEAAQLIGIELVDTTSRMQTGAPQDLVGEQVAEPSHHRLVHERRLETTPPSVECQREFTARQAEGIRTLTPHDAFDLALGVRQPEPLELALIPVTQDTIVGDDNDPVVLMTVFPLPCPQQLASHPEVQHHDRAVGASEQPFAAAGRMLEATAVERSPERSGRRVPQHRGIGHFDASDPATLGALEHTAKTLHVGQLRHKPTLRRISWHRPQRNRLVHGIIDAS